MNEVVRDAVDIPGNAHRIDEPKNEHDPERDSREEIEHPEEIEAMQEAGRNRDRVPTRLGKQFGISCDSFDDYGISFHSEDNRLPGEKISFRFAPSFALHYATRKVRV